MIAVSSMWWLTFDHLIFYGNIRSKVTYLEWAESVRLRLRNNRKDVDHLLERLWWLVKIENLELSKISPSALLCFLSVIELLRDYILNSWLHPPISFPVSNLKIFVLVLIHDPPTGLPASSDPPPPGFFPCCYQNDLSTLQIWLYHPSQNSPRDPHLLQWKFSSLCCTIPYSPFLPMPSFLAISPP